MLHEQQPLVPSMARGISNHASTPPKEKRFRFLKTVAFALIPEKSFVTAH
jgi:hypothetical protein